MLPKEQIAKSRCAHPDTFPYYNLDVVLESGPVVPSSCFFLATCFSCCCFLSQLVPLLGMMGRANLTNLALLARTATSAALVGYRKRLEYPSDAELDRAQPAAKPRLYPVEKTFDLNCSAVIDVVPLPPCTNTTQGRKLPKPRGAYSEYYLPLRGENIMRGSKTNVARLRWDVQPYSSHT